MVVLAGAVAAALIESDLMAARRAGVQIVRLRMEYPLVDSPQERCPHDRATDGQHPRHFPHRVIVARRSAVLKSLRERWRYLAWFDVKIARLWQSVVCVGVVAVMALILGLLMWSL